MLAVAIPVSFKSAQLFKDITVESENTVILEQSSARANEVEQLLTSYIDKIKVVSALLLKEYSNKQDREKDLQLTFRQDRDLVSVEVRSHRDNHKNWRVVNENYLKDYKLDKSYIDRVSEFQKKYNLFREAAVYAGQIEVRNASLQGGAPMLSIGVPIVTDAYGNITHIAVADIRLDRIQKIFGHKGVHTIYLVDKDGRLIAHPDEKKVLRFESVANLEVVKDALAAQVRSQQEEKAHPDGIMYISAFTKTTLGVTVVAEAAKSVILENAQVIRRKSLYIAGRVLSIALFLIFIFSISITSPIEKLVEVTKRLAQGDFEVSANVKTRDEVGELASSFDSMVSGLRERDKMKNVLNKFHGSAITDDLLSGELELGGSNKNVTVFFSDIRGFTKFSEGHSAEQVVDMLNEYFSIMVGIINKNKGVVDKFIGDAIMAVWGAPQTTAEDSINAVRACLEMRIALDELNKERLERGQVPIMIGMGLHSGEAISGNIGSDERMEYTVIGDTVNQASRIEASTKAFGTDLLISDTLYHDCQESFVIEKAGDVEVKGKSKPLSLYKVLGYVENGEQVILKTDYSDYAAGAADKVKMVG